MTRTSPTWALPTDVRSPQALLDTAAARAIDKAAIAAGTPEVELMERAGAATAAAIQARWQPHPTLVLTGPGNNGGDGFVIARLLREAGWDVRVAGMKQRDKLSGAAAIAAGRWPDTIEDLVPDALRRAELVVDALFGIGLGRPLDGVARAVVEALNANPVPVVAVDIASGVDSDSGAVLGAAIEADLTVTFFRRKPGHLLLPGRDLSGDIVVSDLNVDAQIYASIPATIFANEPDLWIDAVPWPTSGSHKYTRGHAVVLGGTKMTGAARLAAHAAQRVGAGLVTIASDPSVASLYAAWRADLLVSSVATPQDFTDLLADRRLNAVLLGPGAGVDARLEAAIATALDAEVGLVLDADAFRVLAEANGLLGRLNKRVLMTPHEGEFQRVFGPPSPRVPAALKAAAGTGATVLLKGSDTIIATPDGKLIVNTGAPPDLATAGSGDVLAGLAVGLLANRLSPTLAASMACWIHGKAASLFGPGLIAGDLPDMVPRILTILRNFQKST
jgi:ADP-dependent NAD(P)H-hydrate dehydratase / NAD(P)H-hydrate epimerase